MNLAKKKIAIDSNCSICGREEESTLHIVWNCPTASDVWSERGSPVEKWGYNEANFMDLWRRLNMKLGPEEFIVVAYGMRQLWMRRNSLLFESSLDQPRSVMQKARQSQHEFSATLEQQRTRRHQQAVNRSVSHWQKPVGLTCKANWDVVLNKENKKIGIGIIVRNGEGDSMAVMCSTTNYLTQLVIAEALALKKACEFCVDLGMAQVIFEGDCQVVVRDVNSKDDSLTSYGSVITDIRIMLAERPQWSTSFTYRESNNIARVSKISSFITLGNCLD